MYKWLTAAAFLFALAIFGAGCILSSKHARAVPVPVTLGAEPVEISSPSGSVLKGSWIPGAPGRPAVLLMHGVRADRSALFKRASLFKGYGYGVLMFDFQAHGESPGDNITFGFLEARDAKAAFEFLRARAPGVPIGIVGLSMGGASALLGASPLAADALVLESVYPDIRTATDNRIRRWVGPLSYLLTPILMQRMAFRFDLTENDLRPVAHIGDFHKPVLILSGSEDQHTTVKDTEALFAAANEPKEMVLFEGAVHQDLYDFDPARYEATVGGFFKKALEKQ